MPPNTYTTPSGIIARIQEHMTTNGIEANTGIRTQELLIELVLSVLAIIGNVPPIVLGFFPLWDEDNLYEGGVEKVVKWNNKLYLFVGSTDDIGTEPGTNEAVWQEISALQLAHFRNSDLMLAEGTADQVTAAEIRALLDAPEGPTPTLEQVLMAGMWSGVKSIGISPDQVLQWQQGSGAKMSLLPATLGDDHVATIPAKSGTLAMLDDVAAVAAMLDAMASRKELGWRWYWENGGLPGFWTSSANPVTTTSIRIRYQPMDSGLDTKPYWESVKPGIIHIQLPNSWLRTSFRVNTITIEAEYVTLGVEHLIGVDWFTLDFGGHLITYESTDGGGSFASIEGHPYDSPALVDVLATKVDVSALGTAAYEAVEAFEPAGAAHDAEVAAKAYADDVAAAATAIAEGNAAAYTDDQLHAHGTATDPHGDRAYTDAQIAAAVTSAYRPAGSHDITSGWPTSGTGTAGAIRAGDTWKVSAPGGHQGGLTLDVGDTFYAVVDNASLDADFDRFDHNTEQATETTRGTVAMATTPEVEDSSSTNDIDAVSPKKAWSLFRKGLSIADFFAAVFGATLTGFTPGTNTSVTSGHTLYTAIRDMQAQLNAHLTNIGTRLLASLNLSDLASPAAARINIGMESAQGVGDANASLNGSRVVVIFAALTAPRTYEMPNGALFNPGGSFYIVDGVGGLSTGNYVTLIANSVAPATINGAATMVLSKPNTALQFTWNPSPATRWVVNMVDVSEVTGLAAALAAKADASTLTSHTSNTSNPHSVTKAQVGLASVTNDAQAKAASNLSDLADPKAAYANLGGAFSDFLGAQTTGFALVTGDRGKVIPCAPASADITITGNAATLGDGFHVALYKSNTNDWTVTIPGGVVLRLEGSTAIIASDGTNWNVIQAPPPVVNVCFQGQYNSGWTDMASALAHYGGSGNRMVQLVDLSRAKKVRMTCLVSTVGSGSSKLFMRWHTSNSTTASDYQAFSSSVEVPITSLGYQDSGWVDVPSGARGLNFVALLGSGGNGSTDPAFGPIHLYIHNA